MAEVVGVARAVAAAGDAFRGTPSAMETSKSFSSLVTLASAVRSTADKIVSRWSPSSGEDNHAELLERRVFAEQQVRLEKLEAAGRVKKLKRDEIENLWAHYKRISAVHRRDGLIDRVEFVEVMKLFALDDSPLIDEIFNVMDRDRDGYVATNAQERAHPALIRRRIPPPPQQARFRRVPHGRQDFHARHDHGAPPLHLPRL